MQQKTKKLYCFVDETGQDTAGKLFLVSVILKEKDQLESLRDRLEQIERFSGKGNVKWKKTSFTIKQIYLSELMKLFDLRKSVYYSVYQNTKDYTKLVAQTIFKSIKHQNISDYTVNIVIDALNQVESRRVKGELKRLGVKYKTVRGLRDEQDVFLRLADSMAGFLRDAIEKQDYTKKIIIKFKKTGIVTQI